MLRGLYTAYSGMQAQQLRMDTISNNLANVNTTGFKQDGVIFESFQDLLISKINDPEKRGSERIGSMSFGVGVGTTYVNHVQGALNQTGVTHQLAIMGDGFFTVGIKQADGSYLEKYTRDGSFSIGPNGELLTLDGNYVMGEDGPISITSLDQLIINEIGEVYDQGQKVGTLKMKAFEDPNQLNKLGASLYEISSAAVEVPFRGTLMQGYLEASNVNSIEEMVNMINVMRTYESSQKVLSTYDSTLEQAVNSIARL